MVYSFELIKHANIRYRDAIVRLGRCELICLLRSLSVDTDAVVEKLGSSVFLTFESRELSPGELSALSQHSLVVFMAEKTAGGLLLPLDVVSPAYLQEDLPELLKYKGKTGVSFTRMMINIASALSSPAASAEPPLLFDPLCGKATTCFCALAAGMNAVGLDYDRKAVREAADFFTRYLKYHLLKHRTLDRSETFQKASLPVKEFIFADTREHYLAGDCRTLSLVCGDTAFSPGLFRRRKADLLVADLPYGIQHAPQAGQKAESFRQFLHRALPAWRSALRPGGAAALSFNTLTLPADHVRDALRKAGFTPCEDPILGSLRHEVEQAVVRDVIFALNEKEDHTNGRS